MEWVGVNYDIGTRYGTGDDAPDSCESYDVENRLDEDLALIAGPLACNTVQLFGTDTDLLVTAAHTARSLGLTVWFQPRLVDAAADDHLLYLAEAAEAAESVRAEHGDVVFSVGVELSLFLRGFVSGDSLEDRMGKLFGPDVDPVALESDLDEHLAAAERIARNLFDGPISYGSGMWEPVRWDVRFDLIGVDLYVRPIDERHIAELLADHRRVGKPVVVTEYGCVTHEGALAEYGADVVDWAARPPRLLGGVQRSEETQAEGVTRQFESIRNGGAAGALCFVFAEPRYRSDAGGIDLDAASFGLVRPPLPGSPGLSGLTRKAAFHQLAKLHVDATSR